MHCLFDYTLLKFYQILDKSNFISNYTLCEIYNFIKFEENLFVKQPF